MPGVAIPESLRERYPQEMTIVLQHQFWDLEIGKNKFAVTLSFQRQPEQLVVPFAAVRSFADPSVNFALEFALPERAEAAPSLVSASDADNRRGARPIAPPVQSRPRPPPNKTPEGGEVTGAEVVTLDSFRKR